jgi:hypothetical protein
MRAMYSVGTRHVVSLLTRNLKFTLPVRCKEQTRFYIFLSQLREVSYNIFERHTRPKPSEYIRNCDSGIPDAGFAKSFICADADDAIILLHLSKVVII